ncbi:hypothetical protein M5D96_010034 [Drosophila gunungcola]|uniref:Uncharacterized protein n=1 Tax=Drosophila gunungcola TaxID=103775 RepID=A0A9P9YIM5_9MUSC|nr:hypothetical protein M5D96_010034 [Drosophila gunungcola]
MDSYDPGPSNILRHFALSNGRYANENATWQLPVTCSQLGWWQEFVAERKSLRNRLALPLAKQSLRQLIGINQLNYEIFDKIATPLLRRRYSCGKTKLSCFEV